MTELSLLAALVGGLVILVVSGDLLVGGAVSVTRRLGLSPLVAGIFIVGFGTSAPEMIVAVDAAIEGYPALSLGNIVGSNIANVWLVLGLPALLAPVVTGMYGERRAVTAVLVATLAWIVITGLSPLHAGVGAAFLLALVGYAVYTFRVTARAARRGVDVGVDDDLPDLGVVRGLVYVLIGLIGLPLGAHLIVDGGVGIARLLDVREEIIGLTLLAVGTSLPEIGAGMAAALKGRNAVIVGNVLGSNLFNLLAAGGIIAFFNGPDGNPIRITETFVRYDHWALAAATLTLAGLIYLRGRITRLAGVALLLLYALYVYGLLQRWNFLAFVGHG